MKALNIMICGMAIMFTATASAVQQCEKVNNEYVFTESIENQYTVTTNNENNLHQSELQPTKRQDRVNSTHVEETSCYDVISSLTVISFDFDKHEIKSGDRLTLDALSRRDNLPARLVVVGHTDNEGNAAYNYDLGLRRADTVKQYLEVKGIKNISLFTRSEGQMKPRCVGNDNSVSACNRRVEIFYEVRQ